MNEGSVEFRHTTPAPASVEHEGNFESAPLDREVVFSERQQDLLAKLIAEGKSAAEQIAYIDKEFGPPKDGHYSIASVMSPHELDLLVRSLQEDNILYTDLPDDAISAICTLGLLDHFQSGRVSAVTDKNLKEGHRVLSVPLFYQKDDLESWNNYRDPEKSAEMRRNFFLNQIQKIESIHMLKMRRSQEKNKLDRNSENFAEELKSLDESIESLDGSIRSICDSVVNYVNTSGVSFEDLFPEVSEDLHLFIYKTAGGVFEEIQDLSQIAS